MGVESSKILLGIFPQCCAMVRSMDLELTRAAINRAVKAAGNQTRLVHALGLSGQPNVTKWLKRGLMPAKWVLKTEALTGVSRHDLRPDIYPIENNEQ